MADVWDFLVKERGLSPKTLKEFGVEKLDDGGVMFPFPGGKKYRWHDDTGKRHFKTEREALNLGLFGRGGTSVAFITEGESDAYVLDRKHLSKLVPLEYPELMDGRKVTLPYFTNTSEYTLSSTMMQTTRYRLPLIVVGVRYAPTLVARLRGFISRKVSKTFANSSTPILGRLWKN